VSIDIKQASRSLARLAVLRYFPADDTVRAEIVALACRMAATNEQIDWLADRCADLWNEWQGPQEMRAVFCSKFRPADGREEFSQLAQFADGIPSEKESASYVMLGAGKAAAQIEGTVVEDPVFPRAGFDLLHEALERRKAIDNATLPTETEIDRIKRQQESTRAGDAAVRELEQKLRRGR
jgi:hypothetical protein